MADVFRLLPALLDEEVPRLEREQRAAERDLADLLALARAERASKVQRARKRFRSAGLVRLLVAESRKQVHRDPDEAFHLAELARSLAHRNPRMTGYFSLLVLTTAEMANACRAGSHLMIAGQHFSHARSVNSQYGVTDTEILARADSLEGSLRMDEPCLERVCPQRRAEALPLRPLPPATVSFWRETVTMPRWFRSKISRCCISARGEPRT